MVRERGDRPLPRIAGHVVDVEWAPRDGMRADLVRSRPEHFLAIALAVVGILRRDEIAMRKLARVRPFGRALPFQLAAKARARQTARGAQPRYVRLRVS